MSMITRAKDIMTTELIVGHPQMTVEEAIKTLVNNRITGMPILDEQRQIVGVVSEYDIIKSVESDADRIDLQQKIDFSKKVSLVLEDTPLDEILKQFTEKKVRRLPVLNKQNQLVGIITRRDIMRVLFYRSKIK